ncbi:SDR family NAD(P)-dependent oxidoreductase [Nocardiopsis trehalosi]|uniref:SDR family NAD(P)-dependent oxidoreductase n=1 Tax=Nocardiopsis trehalosi TaxID=109329 RepID=UPI0008343F67|nr:SDR family NAD(P)-dependent oxidoreductase [Nocardiopsis trehalosi]
MGHLDGRIAVVTGAGNGIGREHARYFAAEGASVVVNDPGVAPDGSGGDPGVAARVVAEITAAGGTAVASTDSVADHEGARRVVATAVEAFGDLHAVVANAGILRNAPFLDMTPADLDAVLGVHLTGTFAVAQAAGRYWRGRHAAGDAADRSIVTTASGSGLFTPLPTQANYASAKAGVAALTTVAALELRRYGVRVNCYAPSAHRTRLTRDVPGMAAGPRADGHDPFDPRASSALVAYLASADCPLTGQVFQVHDRTVRVAQGWSVRGEVAADRPWTVDTLAEALAATDLEDPEAPLLRAMGALDDPDRARAAVRALLGG